ncbi:UDP-N-acetylmuramate dehydrogenase [Thalassotalea ponticola]|uniref:UDP-N-acetylmuramate dehydrogenase n=1 Tax=Thalassotalea ponticola TaxID=1523392 RepID=UPI0025B33035|nr:UDP-N-acetylmuramate dehydrogenase [Thalassotalea ponticola]MDN3652824.1 UDP-N-acetylmuramate dehydrogenase [Thalassotalea ponticola]
MQYYHSLKSLTSFALEAKAAHLVELSSLADLERLSANLPEPRYVLGGGSNTLFIEDFNGTIICPKFEGISVKEDDQAYYLHVASGENWHQLVCYCLANKMPGLENLALIPGDCGAAPIQNIGAYGVEFSDVCQYVDWFEFSTGKMHRLSLNQCEFAYRDSVFKRRLKDKGIICAIGIRLAKQWQPKLSYAGLSDLTGAVTPRHVFDTVVAIRQSKLPDPDVMPNAGSFFKNPIVDYSTYQALLSEFEHLPCYVQADNTVKLAAGWLIDQCQLKGYQHKGAAVHVKQALVLVNVNNAKGDDVIALAKHVQQAVYDKFAVTLQPEVRFVGRNGEMTLAQFS